MRTLCYTVPRKYGGLAQYVKPELRDESITMDPSQPKPLRDNFDGWDVSEPTAHNLPVAALVSKSLFSSPWTLFFRGQSAQNESGISSTAGAIAGAALGATAAGIVWLAFALSVAAEVGYVAILIGFIAGHGARLGAGARARIAPRICALTFTIAGIFACKYLLFAYEFVAQSQGATGYFAPETWAALHGELQFWFSTFELFWGGLALVAAWLTSARSSAARRA